MQQTEHLKLNIIEGGDPVDWEVMNENAEKLEAETARLDGALTQGLAAVADSMAVKNIAVGSYTGNDGTQTINVGFTPKVVWVCNQRISVPDGYLCGMAVTGGNGTSGTATLLKIITNGFQIISVSGSTLNLSSYTYNYLAVA